MTKQLVLGAMLLCVSVSAHSADSYRLANVAKITNDVSTRYDNPVWSPSGNQLAFTRMGFDGLYVADLSADSYRQVSNLEGVGYMFQWRADGKEILVRDTRWNGSKRLHAAWSVNVSDKTASRLSGDAEYMQPAAWRYGNDGSTSIVYDGNSIPAKSKLSTTSMPVSKLATSVANSQISFDTDCEKLYAVDGKGNKTVIYEGAAFGPKLSPDGKRVAFSTMYDEIKTINIDGSGVATVTKGFSPDWVDSGHIIFHRTTDDGHTYLSGQLYVVNVKSGAESKLSTSSTSIEMNPSVSPGGDKIAFMRYDDGQIYVADLVK